MQLLITLSWLYKVQAWINKLELVVVEVATQSEHTWERRSSHMGVMAHDGNSELVSEELDIV